MGSCPDTDIDPTYFWFRVATGWYSFQRPEVILIFVIFFRRPSNVCLDLEYVVSLFANSLAESKNAVVVVTSHKQLSFPSVQLCVPLYQSPQNPQVHSRFQTVVSWGQDAKGLVSLISVSFKESKKGISWKTKRLVKKTNKQTKELKGRATPLEN